MCCFIADNQFMSIENTVYRKQQLNKLQFPYEEDNAKLTILIAQQGEITIEKE
jgi:hypothetical protein